MPDFMHDNPNSIPDAPGHLTSNGIFFAENAAPMAYLPPDSLYHHALSTSFPLARAPPPPFSASPPASPPDPLLEIFYPGWPQSLPTPLLVMRLIDVYFQKPHAASGMVNQAKFLTSMSLPPTHSKFPHVSLIHAMLATAARMVGPTFFAQEEKYWGLEDREQTVADYHAKKSMVAIDTAIAKGQSLLQVAQSIVLICLWSFTAARFVEVWVYIGLATRLSTPLGLNHIRAVQLWNDGTSGDRPPHMKANILPATGDEEELYERAATFWLGVVCDRFASASTGWSMGIDELDITSLLPSPGSTYSTGDLMSSPLSPHNPSFIMSHPPHLVHCFQLYLKAVILLGRVVSFMQRAPSPVGMGPNAPDPRRNPSSQPNPGSKPVDLRTTPEFKALDADAVTFRLSVPREMQASMHTSADVRMVLVFVVPHITTILLHEPFCTLAEDDVSLARCLLSARAVLEMVYTLLGTSFEVSLLPPFICFCWAVVGRTLVRELAIKEATGKTSGVEQLKMDVQTIIIAMRAYRSPLGDSVSTALQTLLDSPARCLPHEDLGVAGLACGTNGPMSVAYGRLCQADDGSTPCPFTGSKKRAYANGGEAEPEASGELPVEVDYAALFSQQEGATPDDDRFKELLGMGSIEGMMSGGWSPEGESGFEGYHFSGEPSALAQSLVLSRLASAQTLLPVQLARLITALSFASRLSVRISALFVEVILEAAKYTTMTGLGITRRALIAAIGSARALSLIDDRLDWSGRDVNGVKSTEPYLKVLDQWTNLGIYMVHHTFTLAELFAMSGFYLTLATIRTGFDAAEESVRMFESILGSNETSRALASIITLVRDELTQDPRFTPAERGAIASLTALTKALTAYVCLQTATHKRTLKEMRLRVVYDCTIVLEDISSPRDFSLADYGRRLDEQLDRQQAASSSAIPPSPTPPLRQRERTVSIDAVMSDFRNELEANGGRMPRSRQNSGDEGIEVVTELEELCGSSDEGDHGSDDELPEEVRAALREVEEEGPGSVKRMVRTAESEYDYEIETEETTTKTTTTIRVVPGSATDSDSSTNPSSSSMPRTISRKTKARPRVAVLGGHIQELEPGDDLVEDGSEDEWVELSTVVSETHVHPMDEDDVFATLNELPSAENGAGTLALLSRQDTLDHPTESKERFHFVIEKLTKTLTQRKRTIRRVDLQSRSSSPSAGPRPKLFERNSGKSPKRERHAPDVNADDVPASPPKSKHSGSNIMRAFGRAIRKTASGENLSSSGRNSRQNSSGSITTISEDPSPASTPPLSTPPLPSQPFPSEPSSPLLGPADISSSSSSPNPDLFTTPATPPRPSISTTPSTPPKKSAPPSKGKGPLQSAKPLAFGPGAPHDRQRNLGPPIPISPLRGGVKPHGGPPSSRPARLRRTTSNESMRSVTTTVTHVQEGPEPEEAEPKAANFPREHLVKNLLTFMRYSSAAYGQTFLRILGMGKGDFNFPHTEHHANNHAFAHHVGIGVECVLLSSYSDPESLFTASAKISPLVNFVAVDHKMKAIVLSCRGSLGLSDLLVDLTCAYETVPLAYGNVGESYYAHSGMYCSATKMQRGMVHTTIDEGLRKYPDYGLVICGHSLGGGVAALLAMLWSMPTPAYLLNQASYSSHWRPDRPPPPATPFVTSIHSGFPAGRPIICYSYGPPCTASPDLVRYCRGLVISTIHNYDIVPTLSLGVVRDLKSTAMAMYTDSGMVEEIVGRVIGLHQRRFMANRSKKTPASQGAYDDSELYSHPLTQPPDEALEVPLSDAELGAGRGSNRAKDPTYRDPSLLGPDISDDKDLNDWMWSLVRTMRAGNDAEKIYPPGIVYIIESWTVFVFSETEPSDWRRPAKQTRREGRRVVLRLVEDVEARFSEPIFGRTMMSDHSPSGYEEKLESLAFAMG
ncbi:hypothetical protein RQP46_007786 [Phenoliferia psychrophenolica]